MMKIVLASNNSKKIAELGTLLAAGSSNGVEVLSLRQIGVTEDIEETGETFEENSLIKSGTPAALGFPGIADDSGLTVDVLNGAPGIYSARFAGEHGDDAANRAKLLESLAGVSMEKRTAGFVCVASLVLPADSPLVIPKKWRISEELSEKTGIPADRAMTVRGECRGLILTEERGDGGFGYDSLFWYPAFGATFAEVSQERKNRVSHRAVALRVFTKRLRRILAQNGERYAER